MESSQQQAREKMEEPVTILGDEVQSGAYILRISVAEPLALAFGRFRGGEPVSLPAGDYLYVGSAMGTKGASSLARRLVRHATRSGDRSPHPIRPHLLAVLAARGMGRGDLRPRGPKSLFWHADYLLDPAEVSLTHVLAIRTTGRLEASLADLIAARPYTGVPARGLGASDAAGATHLFSAQPVAGWWADLVAAVRAQLAGQGSPRT